MTSDEELDLDDKLNENLDFLEEEDLEPNSVNPSSFNDSFLNKFNLKNTPKKVLLIGAGIVLTIIIFYLMPKNKATNNSTVPKLTPLNKSKNTKLSTSTKLPTSQENAKQINQIEQIDQPQQTENNPQDQNNNLKNPENTSLTWEELQKFVEPQQLNNPNNDLNTDPTNALKDQNISKPTELSNNKTDNTPVSGFEIIKPDDNTTTPTLLQNNINPKTQERLQEHIEELKNIINNITEDLTANVKQIKDLHNNLSEISQSIYQVNNNVSNVDSKISSLSGAVDNLSSDLKNVKKYIQEEELNLTSQHLKPSEPDLFSNTLEYTVHAIIPGRAWLKSSSGQTITVTEGDHLGDYGKIAFIDPHNHIVRTSSGVIFR